MHTACTKGRIDAGVRDGIFDAEFTHVGDFSAAEREMTIRAHAAADGGVCITHTR